MGCLRSFIAASCFILGGYDIARAADPVALTWAAPVFPPAFIEDGAGLSGYGAQTQNWFTERLPDYRHNNVILPISRILAEIRNGTLVCSSSLIPTEDRKSYISFADTILLHLPVTVIIRETDRDRFAGYLDANGHLDFSSLVSDTSLRAALRSGRAYGPAIDTILDHIPQTAHITRISNDDKFLALLDLKRIDWTLFFPSEIEYFRRQINPQTGFTTLPVAGNTDLLQATYGCSNTPAGQAAIAAINDIVDDHPDMPWTHFYATWLSDADRAWYANAVRIWQNGRNRPPS
ncbi:hypothetical protein [Thalassospira sp.]|uniref:hypothetical protein n=1 Tax=Thalassospira sp. TaxID=1912094 RepID=UPI002734EB32|nr:hypothetical protein [Thalassospira sp.]MDP2698686.1 hypothetical protein [Thalassospira sp.]